MVGAHTPSGGAAVRMHGHARVCLRTRGEGGFTLVEMLVVLVIVAILMAAVLPNVLNQRRSTTGASVNVAAGAIWRGVQSFRVDNLGTFPTTLTAGGSNLVDPAGERYIRRWPEGPDGAPMRVQQGGASPPTSISPPGQGGMVQYRFNGNSGWVAGYDSRGRMVFRRGVSASTTPMVPAG